MKKASVAVYLALIFGFTSQAQKAEQALKALTAAFPAEKIYIHYDKDYYAAGQTVWFKGYLYSNWKPSGLSNNFYIQLTNDKGDVISHKEYPVIGATVKGSIDIPDSLEQGNYYVRAFTPGIMNYDETLIYKKRLPVYSKKVASVKATLPPPTLAIQFYPESGDLLDDMLMTVGFKAVNERGLPVEVSGIIKLEDGTTIAPFKTYHDGIGKMQLKARAGKKYIAEVETAEGIKKFPLPEVKQYGVNLKVSDEKGGKKFLITRKYKQVSDYANLMIVADINNVVVYKMDIQMDDYPDAEGHIVTDNLPSGIMHFTVFEKNGLPLCERLAFVNNGEYKGKAEIGTVKVNLQKRAANELELQFPDNTLRSCSVSVTDIASTENDDIDNIYSSLLLTSDVKGYIYNPAWYFKENNDSASQAVDNLLLTHGWSRYNWQKILAGELPTKTYADPHMITVSGQVFDQKTNAAVSNGNLNVLIELGAGKPKSYTVPVNETGNFSIDSLAFYGDTKIYFDYADKSGKDKPITVKLNENATSMALLQKTRSVPLVVADVDRYKYFDASISSDNVAKIGAVQNADTIKTLEKVSVKTTKVAEKRPIEVLNEKYTSGLFIQQARTAIDNVTNPAADGNMDALRFVQNRITQVQLVDGVFYSKHKNNLSMTDWSKNFTKGSNALDAPGEASTAINQALETKNKGILAAPEYLTSQNVVSGYPVLLYLNEIQVETAQLKALSAKDIAFVKYFENFSGGGMGTIGGAIAIYTVNRDYTIKAPADYPEYALKASGYSITKEFFNPDYGDPEYKQPESDGRTTLYWSAAIMTNPETKSIKLNFYNNDFSKKLKVTLEGFDAEGKLIHVEKTITQ